MAKRRKCVNQYLPMLDLCLTLAEDSFQQLSEKIRRYAGQVSMIEVRLDYLEDPEIPDLPLESGTQFIATFRPQRQGGRYSGSEKERLKILVEAACRGFQWVDLEVDAGEDPDLPNGTAIIRSLHVFEGFPEDLESHLTELSACGGAVLKLAVSVTTTEELCSLLLWMERLPSDLRRVIIGMNAIGQVSRLLGGFCGNAWTYVAEEDEDTAAPGQFSLEKARFVYRLDRFAEDPVLYAGMGDPVSQDQVVLLYNRLFEHYRQNALYIPLYLTDIESWLGYVSESCLRFGGFSVGEPFSDTLRCHLATATGSLPIDTLTKEGENWIPTAVVKNFCAGSSQGALTELVAEQFRTWTNIEPDRNFIEETLNG